MTKYWGKITSRVQVHELPLRNSGDNWEGTLLLWLHKYYARLASVRFEQSVCRGSFSWIFRTEYIKWMVLTKSWKLCLKLSSRRSLTPRQSLVRNLIPCRLWHLNTLFGEGLINFSMVFLKVLYVFEFLRLVPSLFHSITVDGKKVF